MTIADPLSSCNGVTRYIQLKSRHRVGKNVKVTVNASIAAQPNGCVIWLMFDDEMKDLTFWWFGRPPSSLVPSLGDRIGRHTKGNAQGEKTGRPRTRVLRLSQFDRLNSIAELASR